MTIANTAIVVLLAVIVVLLLVAISYLSDIAHDICHIAAQTDQANPAGTLEDEFAKLDRQARNQ